MGCDLVPLITELNYVVSRYGKRRVQACEPKGS